MCVLWKLRVVSRGNFVIIHMYMYASIPRLLFILFYSLSYDITGGSTVASVASCVTTTIIQFNSIQFLLSLHIVQAHMQRKEGYGT